MSTPAVVEKGKPAGDVALALWREYKATGDTRVRNHLVMGFMPMVRHLVYTKMSGMPSRYDFDDFVSCGIEALIGAVERYDPDKGAPLDQFLWMRVRGALIDELRRMDWAPRGVRRWQREIGNKRDRFAAVHGRYPTVDELAAELGITPSALRAKLGDLEVADMASLNGPTDTEDGDTELLGMIADTDIRSDPESATSIQLAKERFRDAFGSLPRRQREVAIMLYVKNLTLREIGDLIGVTESRVSQIHTQLRDRLRDLLSDDAALFEALV
jgi:RNA polymerase sigma factor for flagellar operon FliA